MVFRRIHRVLAGVAVGAVLALVGVAAPAQASPSAHTTQATAGSATRTPSVGVTPQETPPPGYVFIDEYFWHSDCEAHGRAGMNSAWTAYLCINGSGSPFDDYELWVKPK